MASHSIEIIAFWIMYSSLTIDSQKINTGIVNDDARSIENYISQGPYSGDIRTVHINTQNTENLVRYDHLQQVKDQIDEEKLQAVIGDYDPNVAMATEKKNIPYIITSLSTVVTPTRNLIHMAPTIEDMADCCSKLIKRYEWTNYGLLYGEDIDYTFQALLLNNGNAFVNTWQVTNHDTQELTESELKPPLLELRSSRITEILVIADTNCQESILSLAQRLGMLGDPYKWVFVNLMGLNTTRGLLTDLSTNVTTVQLAKATVPHQHSVLDDALYTLVTAQSSPSDNLIQDILQVNMTGETGMINFDESGYRVNYSLDIYSHYRWNYTQVGVWYKDISNTTLIFSETGLQDVPTTTPSIRGKHLKVVSILEEPWFMLAPPRTDGKERTGNDRFKGYVLDFLSDLSTNLQFTYELYQVPDGQFGALDPETEEWTGLMGQVISGEAHMAVASLSINAQRERAADFTKPFHTRSINVLIKSEQPESNVFQFIKPLAASVWFIILSSIVVVMFVMVIAEKYGTPMRGDGVNLGGTESAWFVVSGILQGGVDNAPHTFAGRILSIMWWFFALIMISSYTANLTAFLTVNKINPPISSIYDLTSQQKIKFGTVRNSGVESFFKTAKEANTEPFASMWTQMSLHPDYMVNSTDEAIEKVKEGDYAFIWDNTVTKYQATQNCNLTLIGPDFDQKGFGIALPPGSFYRDELTIGLLKLGDSGHLTQYVNEWWDSSICPDDAPVADETTELTIAHVAGIFITLAFGIAVSIVAIVIDCLFRKVKNSGAFKRGKTKPKKNGDYLPPFSHAYQTKEATL